MAGTKENTKGSQVESQVVSTDSPKDRLDVLQAHSLRSLVETVNRYNSTSPNKILKDDIVTLVNKEDVWLMLYYK